MNFKNWMENTINQGEWHTFNGTGYSVKMSQHSNKGPIFIIDDHQGKEIGRAYFDVAVLKWKSQN